MALLRAPGNRTIEYLTAGPADGLPLVFHHGAPGSAVLHPPLVDRAAEAGWRGDDDLMVPPAHGEWLTTHVAGAEDRLLPGEGHLSLLGAPLGPIVDELALGPGCEAARYTGFPTSEWRNR